MADNEDAGIRDERASEGAEHGDTMEDVERERAEGDEMELAKLAKKRKTKKRGRRRGGGRRGRRRRRRIGRAR